MKRRASAPSRSNEWATDATTFARWNRIYRFTIDAAASAWNALLPRYVTKKEDAFKFSFRDERPWTNPPYSRGNLPRWMKFAWRWVLHPMGEAGAQLWGLHVPAYTSEGWWTKYVAHFIGHRFERMELLELPGFANGYRRVYEYFFIDVWFYEGRQVHTERRGKKGSARHASAFIVIGNRRHMPTLEEIRAAA